MSTETRDDSDPIQSMHVPIRKCLGWPGLGKLAHAYGVLGPPLLVWFVLIYGGADYLTGLHDFRVRLHFAAELSMPFVPAMVLFYNSMHLAYLIAPFVLRTYPEMNAMAATWGLITFGGGVVYLVLPAEDAFATPPDSVLGVWRGMFQLADQANLRYNSCPSMHVAWAVVCIDVYARSSSWLDRLWLWSWGVGMVLSTLLLHQHHLADVLGGLVLALIGSRIVYPRLLQRFRSRSS